MKNQIHLIRNIGIGSLSAMARPTAKGDLQLEFNRIAQHGITRVVSLLEHDEAAAQGLGEEKKLVHSAGMEFEHFPIGDFGVPENLTVFANFIFQQYSDVNTGQHSVVHCHAGIGRTGIVTSSMLLHCGFNPLTAIAEVSEKRGVQIPDTQKQIDWLCDNQKAITSAGC